MCSLRAETWQSLVQPQPKTCMHIGQRKFLSVLSMNANDCETLMNTGLGGGHE